ncbi:hypothetical protein [Nocardioides marmoribigeumensis]|uniref:Uncharacterized protein n=1 Tax=Nocardioides marmoribigeumensis TaxID=433649 RepID=A0ABU2BW87_9ACTN|nr:hypothetical protein [Nocardioides marmoribigeumensis]MDR7362900.1 hypothetical protein [Nocardioides marmoribigeumensis]
MRSTYKYLAYAICGLVALQAAFVVYADAGLFQWIDQDGGVLDKAALNDDSLSFPGLGGFMLHGMNGMMLIPLVAIVTLVVGFLTKTKGAAARGGLLVGLVALQVTLGLVAHSVPAIGPLHGINAFAIFLTALSAARLMSRQDDAATTTAPTVGKGRTIPGQPEPASSQQLQA